MRGMRNPNKYIIYLYKMLFTAILSFAILGGIIGVVIIMTVVGIIAGTRELYRRRRGY
jgi:hypothetical protein